MITDIQGLIAALGGAEATAQALTASGRPIRTTSVYKWVERRKLPPKWAFTVHAEARRQGIKLTLEQVLSFSSPPPPERSKAA